MLFRSILTILGRFATQVRCQEVIRVAIVASPARKHHVVFTGFGAFEHFTPFHDTQVQLDANLCQVCLQHLRAQRRVRVGDSAAIAQEQAEFLALRYARFLEQRPGLVQIQRRVLYILGVTEQGWRVRVDAFSRLALAKQCADVGFLRSEERL